MFTRAGAPPCRRGCCQDDGASMVATPTSTYFPPHTTRPHVSYPPPPSPPPLSLSLPWALQLAVKSPTLSLIRTPPPFPHPQTPPDNDPYIVKDPCDGCGRCWRCPIAIATTSRNMTTRQLRSQAATTAVKSRTPPAYVADLPALVHPLQTVARIVVAYIQSQSLFQHMWILCHVTNLLHPIPMRHITPFQSPSSPPPPFSAKVTALSLVLPPREEGLLNQVTPPDNDPHRVKGPSMMAAADAGSARLP